MTQTAKKEGSVDHGADAESRTHHHVEVVISRILAKQQEYLKLRSSRHMDVEDAESDGDLR
jgi:hypothetical protein